MSEGLLAETMMSVRKMKELRELFQKYDRDGDGVISRGALEDILQKLCPDILQQEMDLIFRKIDRNYNNLVEYEEFVNAMFMDPTAEPKPPPRCHISSEATYVLFLFWEQTAGRQTRPGPVPKAKLAEAVQMGSRQLRALQARIAKLGEEHREVQSVESKVVSRIAHKEVLAKVEDAPNEVTQEMFARMIWPKIKTFDMKYVLGSFRRYFAQEGLSRILVAVLASKKTGQAAKVDMNASDLKFLFDILDEDDDGTLSVREMVQLGALEVSDALLLSEYLDKDDEDGEISLEELMTLVTGHVGDEFMDSLRGLFASSSMSPKDLWDK
eukprot:s144_g5.t1